MYQTKLITVFIADLVSQKKEEKIPYVKAIRKKWLFSHDLYRWGERQGLCRVLAKKAIYIYHLAYILSRG